MGQLVSSLVSSPHTINSTELDRFSYSLGTTQGYRSTQEDTHSFNHTTINFKNHENNTKEIDLKIFGVYDGHGGKSTSLFLSQELPDIIISELSSEDDHETTFKTVQGAIINRLNKAFFKADYLLFNYLREHSNDVDLQSGSTAIVAIIIDNKYLYSINSGDSRLIISVNGSVKNLSFDHKPNHIGELIRINDAGGSVQFNRVNGILALSRAFGDFTFKRLTSFTYNKSNNLTDEDSSSSNESTPRILTPYETQVTVDPEIITHTIDFIKDEFIVLACDGIYDVFKNDQIINFIRHNLALGLNLNDIISKLLDTAINSADRNTGIGFDNMSIIIIAVQLENETMEQWYERIRLKIEIELGITK